MKKLLALLLLLVLVCPLALVLVGCNKTVEVTFVYQDADQTTLTVAFDDKFAAPTVESTETDRFVGWFTDKECTKPWTVPETLSSSITVYGKWEKIPVYKVTFNYQNSTNQTTDVTFDSFFALPTVADDGDKGFSGWYTDKECTTPWTVPETLTGDITVYGKWHTHDWGDNYLMFVECANPECHAFGRLPSTDSAKENFVYNFNDEKKADIDADYQAILDNLELEADYDAFEELFYAFEDDVEYVIEQYQYAYVFYNTYKTKDYENAYDAISKVRTDLISLYYGLFRKGYDSSYRDQMFEGWTEEEIKEILALSDSYGDPEYVAIKNDIDELILEYNHAVSAKKVDVAKLSGMYADLVELNNQLAVLSGYENYMEYAYAVIYEREYSPADVEAMRAFVKEYIVPVADSIYLDYRQVRNLFKTMDPDYRFYIALTAASVFINNEFSVDAVNYMCRYFNELKSTDYDGEVDFYKYAHKLFRDGNYYTGKETGAFSYWISAQNTSILYFSEKHSTYRDYVEYSYQGAFTFVHEFGHYYNGVYNHGLSLSMDHNETQSQGDEMLFLAWLAANKPEGVTDKGYNAVRAAQLVDAFFGICIATAVDEFEQAAYTGLYKGEALPTYKNSTDVDYQTLFSTILNDYGMVVSGNDAYWYYVVFENAGYYISYAMSQLPCVELYVKAMDDFDAAKESYIKLYTFSDDDTFIEVDDGGNRSVTATYAEILHYCNLQDAFEEELYVTIKNHFLGA